MALTPGSHLGPYEVTGRIGAGGMGEVYRARDTRLGRNVALKVVPDAFALDPDRLARFRREAQLLASLNHPHIGAIYGFEESGASHALVLELVEGETLADRIAAAGALPVEEAIAIARQIADALEAAHEHGIVHRDLKPANIKITPDGRVKVLDFGLAKLAQPPDSGHTPSDMSQSPTITSPALMTGAAVILGTAAYMSPEQAKGRDADRRSDIWAFGGVLYEMLTGRRAFEGDDVADTLAAVLRAEPRWEALPPDTPPAIERLLRRCLQKNPRRRLQHIGDARLELDEPAEARVAAPIAAARTPHRIWAFAAATAVVAVVAATGAWMLAPRTPAPPVRRYTVTVPPAPAFFTTFGGIDVTLSPDGRTLFYTAPSIGVLKRRADALTFEPVRGTEGAAAPFVSPDGAWIGFRSEGKLKKVPVEGGLAVTLCDAPGLSRATWGDDGDIIMAGGGDLYKVSSNGGVPQLLLKADRDGAISEPYFIPGSNTVLVRIGPALRSRIQAIELATLARHNLVDGTKPQLAATGDLLFEQRGSLWAVKFDTKHMAVTGTPVPVVESIRAVAGNSQYSTARDGSLAYMASNTDPNRSLVWVDRNGKSTPALDARAGFQSPRLSPDGTHVVVSMLDGSALNLWAYEFERGTRLRLTTNGTSRRTVWSPDGSQVAFYSTPPATGERTASGGQAGGDQDLYVVPATGGEPKKLLARRGAQFPDSWSPDGRILLFEEGEGSADLGAASRDVWMLPLGEAPRPLVVTRFYERGAVFSPDGRWIAFVTDESGRAEVYVQPFPGPGPKIPISNNGGLQPLWSRDGRELFYREGDSMMAVSINLNPFRAGAARKLFEFPGITYNFDQNFADYDVAADGRFLAVQAAAAAADEIQVVVNWTEELRRALGR
jgi:dipeptidyl aminopeptidase/acylaminoacyl peptidase